MVEQDVLELFIVPGFQQRVDRTSRQFGECLIGGSKDCEGAFSFEGVNQSGGLYGSDQCREAAICYSGINDIQHVRGWEKHRIDHMDHTIGGFDVGEDDFGFVDVYTTHVHFDREIFAQQCRS